MLYVKVNEDKYPIEKFNTFTTQAGHDAIRLYGVDLPVFSNGFIIVDEKDNVIANRLKYKYEYRPNEYTNAPEEVIPAESNFVGGSSPSDSVAQQITSLYNMVNELTPYTANKLVGIQDSECIFTGTPQDGVLSAVLKTDRGEYLPCEVARHDDVVRVTFEKLTEVATVTINIQ